MTTSKMPGPSLEPNTEALADGTPALQPGQSPSILLDPYEPKGLKRRDGTWDFSGDIDLARYNMVELIKGKNSTLYNFGSLLVSKMQEIKAEGQVYYWKIDLKKRYTQELQEEYESRKRVAFVRIGEGSNPMPIGKKEKTLGDFDRLVKWGGPANRSTAVLDARYRALGGKVNKKGRVIKIGDVNGVLLSDNSFSGFPKRFQGPNWDDAIVEYGLGYKVEMRLGSMSVCAPARYFRDFSDTAFREFQLYIDQYGLSRQIVE